MLVTSRTMIVYSYCLLFLYVLPRLLNNHPYTVDFYGWWMSDEDDSESFRTVKIFLGLEQGDLRKFVEEHKDENEIIPEDKRLEVLVDIAISNIFSPWIGNRSSRHQT